jgi:hypothetical protein
MWFPKKILETILSWIGPIGLLLILIIIVSGYMIYKHRPVGLDRTELYGLILLSVVAVGLGNLVLKMFKNRKTSKTYRKSNKDK